MPISVEPILEQLKSLKEEGVEHIYFTNEALDILKSSYSQEHALPSEPSLTHTPDKPKPTENPYTSTLSIDTPQVSLPKSEPVLDKHDKPEPVITPIPFTIKGSSKQEKWESLRDIVLNCPECKKHVKSDKKIVFGAGNLDADIFFCGEAPDADEEKVGEPFIGKAGQLLTKIIQAMGLSRQSVYLSNLMSWRPKMDTEVGSRPPTQAEMNFCLPYLKAQIEIVKPKVIVALGATAVNGLLGPDKKRRMSDARGNWYDFNSIPLMITFHPSYLLRNNTNRTKRLAWEDMLKVMEKTNLPISEKQQQYFS